MTREEKEQALKSMLDDLLQYGNQDGSIVSLTLNDVGDKCTVVMMVTEVEQDNYLGFAGY